MHFIRKKSFNFVHFSQKVHNYCLMSCNYIIILFAHQLTWDTYRGQAELKELDGPPFVYTKSINQSDARSPPSQRSNLSDFRRNSEDTDT